MPVRTIVDMVRAAADARGSDLAFTFRTSEGLERQMTFGELDRGARRVGALVSDRMAPGARAILAFAPSFDFVEAFLGCIYAGVVPVPVYPPSPGQLEERVATLDVICRDTGAEAILCDALIGALREHVWHVAPSLRQLWWVDTSEQDGEPDDWVDPGISDTAIAYLQYTSGSTGQPKGVVLEHRHLLANQAQMTVAMAMDRDSVVVSWLPMYHDMGLVGCVLNPIYNQVPAHLMSPLDFVVRPARWLQLVADHHATVSGAPNFGFELCIRKLGPDDVAQLDLSSWRVAFCGAEAVRAETMRRFARHFAPAGFNPAALLPCYGLAEASLIVTGATPGAGHRARWFAADRDSAENTPCAAGDPGACEVTSSGRATVGSRIAIVDRATGRLQPDGEEGEIWVCGPSIAGGYWRNEEASAATFVAALVGAPGPWLRTGDLGIVLDDELYVTGRIQDVLIVRGRNIHPQDIEAAIQAADRRFRPGCGAVFAIDGDDGVALVQETTATDSRELGDLVLAARRAAARSGGIDLDQVVLVAPRTVPKTSSGKLRRRKCRDLLQRGEIEVLSMHRKSTETSHAAAVSLGEVEP